MSTKKSEGLSEAERRAIRERSAEVKASAARPAGKKAERERQEVLDTIEAMPEPDRSITRGLHEAIVGAVPALAPRLWYSQPAYAIDGKVVCFVRSGAKDEVRYVTLGFNDVATLDDGAIWPTSYAVAAVDDEVSTLVAHPVRRATGASET